MSFNSISFMFFFPLVLLIYYICPIKYRHIVILAAGYYFYLSWDIRNVFFLLPITLLSWILGICMQEIWQSGKSEIVRQRLNKFFLAVGICGILGVLCAVKYLDFFIMNLNRVCS